MMWARSSRRIIAGLSVLRTAIPSTVFKSSMNSSTFQQSNGKQISEQILGLTQTKRAEINGLAPHCNTGPDGPPAIKFSVPA